ncbi:acyl-CoA dehydrogenase family protein [Streptomyces sp. NBC_01352]|uniref:Hydroxylase n=1 Tax=Streptomyces plumbiresistens TaxID=511811 RepID=A0ABP7SAY6_9ACTN|nr:MULTISPECIES: acyl-CoA dehydrogenase family protein [unclassified Streptomyces]MCX4705360.1 acyl-CoA dehydrogenase family protein [Streptomyces sp. NBC_01373]
MAHEVVNRIEEIGPKLAALADENEKLGKLSDETVALLRSSGVMRMLQPAKFGGDVAHPRDFAEAVMAVARHDGAAGWVSGVVGVHPWEAAQMDPRLTQEIWGEDPDTWIASPYMPNGIADPVDGGYVLSGRWPFSSGADHCQWDFLGALLGDGKGKPAQPITVLHVVLPRSDYEIIDDSWDVVGLSGTGSKDVVVTNAFIPEHRAISQEDVQDAVAAERNGADETVYKLPFTSMFPLGITSAVIGMCEGALATHVNQQRDRVSVTGTQIRDDPYVLSAAGEAAAEIAASRVQLIDGISRIYDLVDAGKPVSVEDRSEIRRNQIRCAWRAVSALDEIVARSGGNAFRRGNPLQRLWRDAHGGLNHMIHVPGSTYHANTLARMGLELSPPMRIGI